MKKILLMVVAAMMATISVNAQETYDNEIAVAYGGGSNTDLVSSLAKGMFTGKQLDYWGPVSVEYFRHFSSGVGIGAVAAVGGCKWEEHSNAKSTYFTFMPALNSVTPSGRFAQ